MVKQGVEILLSIAFGVIFTLFFTAFSFGWERRFVLYHIRNEIEKDMPLEAVESVIERHKTSYITRQDFENNIQLMVHLDIRNYLSLTMSFEQGVLKSARIVGEDNPQDVPEDVPNDIE